MPFLKLWFLPFRKILRKEMGSELSSSSNRLEGMEQNGVAKGHGTPCALVLSIFPPQVDRAEVERHIVSILAPALKKGEWSRIRSGAHCQPQSLGAKQD